MSAIKALRFMSRITKDCSILKPQLSQRITDAASLSTQSASSMTSELTYGRCEARDRDEMIGFMIREFVTREPIMKAAGCDALNAREFVEYNIDEAIIQGASFLARNADGTICGLRVNGIGEAYDSGDFEYFGKNAGAVSKFCHFMEKGLAKKIGTSRFLRHVAICVEPSAVQCGVATELMNLSLDFARRENLKKVAAMCSWKLPYKLAVKMGYQCVKKVSYGSYVDILRHTTDDDVTPFENLARKEGFASLMVGTI